MSDNPYDAPKSDVSSTSQPPSDKIIGAVSINARELAFTHQFLIWAFLASAGAIFYKPLFILVSPFAAWCLYRTAVVLKLPDGWRMFYLFAGLVPAVSLLAPALAPVGLLFLFAFLRLNARATKVLKSAGVKVGLLGVKTKDIPPRAA